MGNYWLFQFKLSPDSMYDYAENKVNNSFPGTPKLLGKYSGHAQPPIMFFYRLL